MSAPSLPLATQYRITDLFDAGQSIAEIHRETRIPYEQVKAVVDQYREDMRKIMTAGG